jgi:proteasome lid subunit RPN8/RPN11
MTVNIDKNALRHFRTKARDSAKEIMVYLIGTVSVDRVNVEKLEYTTRYAHQTKTAVSWKWSEYQRIKRQAEERGRRIVGWLHSHPNDWDCVMSPADLKVCISEGSRVCGIVSVYGRTTRVRFWRPDSALPCEITHEKANVTEV